MTRLLLLFAAGCIAPATLETTQLNLTPHPAIARDPASVEIFSSGPPERPHVDVAYLHAQQGTYAESEAGLIARLTEAAAARGCDALVIEGPTSRSYGNHREVNAYAGMVGTCVFYTDLPAAQLEAMEKGVRTAQAEQAVNATCRLRRAEAFDRALEATPEQRKAMLLALPTCP